MSEGVAPIQRSSYARGKTRKVYCSRGEGEVLVQEPLWLAWRWVLPAVALHT